jgi:hypothetical protein
MHYAGVVLRGLAVLSFAVLALTACGGAAKHAAQTSTNPLCRKTRHAVAKLQADVAALRKAARTPTHNTLQGNRAVNVATDRFLNDVTLAPIGNLRRNRFIDHAMGTLAGSCEQCFQALEAARPIPSIRAEENGC